MTAEQVSWFVDDVIAGALEGVRGVAQVKRAGGADREIRVSLLPDRLMALGITALDVNEQLRATNVDLAGGRGEVGSQEQTIAFRSPMAIALIGGLLASTFLSLVLVPAAFTIMDDLGRILTRKLSRLIGLKRQNELDGDEPGLIT